MQSRRCRPPLVCQRTATLVCQRPAPALVPSAEIVADFGRGRRSFPLPKSSRTSAEAGALGLAQNGTRGVSRPLLFLISSERAACSVVHVLNSAKAAPLVVLRLRGNGLRSGQRTVDGFWRQHSVTGSRHADTFCGANYGRRFAVLSFEACERAPWAHKVVRPTRGLERSVVASCHSRCDTHGLPSTRGSANPGGWRELVTARARSDPKKDIR